MNVLVTGGAGYVGSHFCKIAKQNHLEPIVLDDLSTGHERFVKFGPFVKASILDTKTVTETLRKYNVRAVFHFAGKALVGESVQKPDLYFHVNAEGTRSVLSAMKECNIKKIVFSSSCSTYGVHNEKISEQTLQAPVSPYGESKLNAEKEILKYQEENEFQIAILRYFNVVGCDPDGELWEDHNPETHIVPNIMQSMKTNDVFSIFGNDHETPDGTCVRDYVDVNDLAEIHIEALRRAEMGPLISNVGSGNGLSILEVINKCENIFGKKLTVQNCEKRPGDPPVLVADVTHFRKWYTRDLTSFEKVLSNLKRNF